MPYICRVVFYNKGKSGRNSKFAWSVCWTLKKKYLYSQLMEEKVQEKDKEQEKYNLYEEI